MFCWSKSHRRKKKGGGSGVGRKAVKVNLDGTPFQCSFDQEFVPLVSSKGARSEVLLLTEDDEEDAICYRSLWGKDLKEFGARKKSRSLGILSERIEEGERKEYVVLPTPPPTPPRPEQEENQSPILLPKVSEESTPLEPEPEPEPPSNLNPVALRLEKLRLDLATNKGEIHDLIFALRNAPLPVQEVSKAILSEPVLSLAEFEERGRERDAWTQTDAPLEREDKGTNTLLFLSPPTTPTSNPASVPRDARFPSWIGLGIPLTPEDHREGSLFWDSAGETSVSVTSSSFESSGEDDSLVLLNNLKNSLHSFHSEEHRLIGGTLSGP